MVTKVEESQCNICLDTIKENENGIRHPGHSFHRRCLGEWVKIHNKCFPDCNIDISSMIPFRSRVYRTFTNFFEKRPTLVVVTQGALLLGANKITKEVVGSSGAALLALGLGLRSIILMFTEGFHATGAGGAAKTALATGTLAAFIEWSPVGAAAAITTWLGSSFSVVMGFQAVLGAAPEGEASRVELLTTSAGLAAIAALSVFNQNGEWPVAAALTALIAGNTLYASVI